MAYKKSPQYNTAVEVSYLLLDIAELEEIWETTHEAGKDAWLENEALTTEQMMRKTLNILANKLAHKIKWREQQNKLDKDK